MKYRIAIALFLIALAVFVGFEMTYPAGWNQIQLGMTKDQVIEAIGQPSYDWRDIKGAFWQSNGLMTTHELNVYFDSGRATMISVERRIGTSKHFYRQGPRFEQVPRP